MLIDHYKDELTVAFEESIEDNKKYDDRELDNFIMNELHVTFNI